MRNGLFWNVEVDVLLILEWKSAVAPPPPPPEILLITVKRPRNVFRLDYTNRKCANKVQSPGTTNRKTRKG